MTDATLGVILTGIFGVIAGAITGFFAFRKGKLDQSSQLIQSALQSQKNSVDQLWLQLNKIKEEHAELKVKYESLHKEHMQVLRENHKLTEKVSDLSMKIEMLETSQVDLPVPHWIKDLKRVMLALNPSYEAVFLKPRGFSKSDYVGFDDFAVWPEQIAEQFEGNDKRVAETQQPWIGFEDVPDKDGNVVKWRILKYPRRVNGMTIGIAGIAIPDSFDELNKFISK